MLSKNKGREIKIEDLEALVQGFDEDIAENLRNFIYNYKYEMAEKEQEEKNTFGHFRKLNIPKEVLDSEVYESPHCYQLKFGKHYTEKDQWYMDWQSEIDVDWGAKTLLDVLKSIEKESGCKIVKFGYNEEYDRAKKISFGKIYGTCTLDECCDDFNLQLSNGNYYHLFFCEAK
jgi:hypothetical protein